MKEWGLEVIRKTIFGDPFIHSLLITVGVLISVDSVGPPKQNWVPIQYRAAPPNASGS